MARKDTGGNAVRLMDSWKPIRDFWITDKRQSAIANVYALLERREKKGEWYASSDWHLEAWAAITHDRVLRYAKNG
jgi:hypothetical protein